LGQYYADAFKTFPDTEVVALMEPNSERGAAVCDKFGIAAHYTDLKRMLQEVQPEVVTIATPGKYFKQTVLAAAATPGVRAIQVEKPFGGPVADADEMVDACAAAGIVFAGGALSRAYPQVQETAARLQAGEFGTVVGASIHAWSAEMLGAGCQHTSVLRLLTGAEVVEVVAWCEELEGMKDSQGRFVDAVDGTTNTNKHQQTPTNTNKHPPPALSPVNPPPPRASVGGKGVQKTQSPTPLACTSLIPRVLARARYRGGDRLPRARGR
jgi:predicted dehydrogenase